MQTRNLFRNLQLLKSNPSTFAWSLWKDGTVKRAGKLDRHVKGGAVVLCNVTACVNVKTVKRLKDGAPGTRTKAGKIKRTVFAWLRGDVDPSPVELVKGRPLTLNPHKGEFRFIYGDTRQPCPTSFEYIIADATGCFEAFPAVPPVE